MTLTSRIDVLELLAVLCLSKGQHSSLRLYICVIAHICAIIAIGINLPKVVDRPQTIASGTDVSEQVVSKLPIVTCAPHPEPQLFWPAHECGQLFSIQNLADSLSPGQHQLRIHIGHDLMGHDPDPSLRMAGSAVPDRYLTFDNVKV
jgi:hypothetical protein